MEFFANTPELLGNTQTFFGILLTFIVLCLFNNESNFLLKLICNMVADFTTNLKDKIEDINKEIKAEEDKCYSEMGEIANNRSYWINQSKSRLPELHKKLIDNNKKELEIKNRILSDVGPEIERYKNSDELLKLKKEHKFVSLYFLILMLVVITLDASCVSCEVGCIFLMLESVVTFYFSSCLWYRYIVEKDENNCVYHEHKHIFRKVVWGLLITIVVWMATMCITVYRVWLLWVLSIVAILVTVFLFSYWLMHNFRYTVRYNNQFIIKHALYIVFVCMAMTCFLSFIKGIQIDDNDAIWSLPLINFQENLHEIAQSIYGVRIAFVLLCSANTFFIPLVLGYLYNHNKAMRIKQIMESSKKDIITKLKQNNEKYQNILKEIQTQSNYN